MIYDIKSIRSSYFDHQLPIRLVETDKMVVFQDAEYPNVF